MRSKIRELGTVNVDAIREYESLMDRYDFMTKQRNDIELSRRELTDLIKDLDLAMVISSSIISMRSVLILIRCLGNYLRAVMLNYHYRTQMKFSALILLLRHNHPVNVCRI